MDRRRLLTATLGAGLAARSPPVLAQSARAVPTRIGWLTAQREPSLAPFLAPLRAGLADLGHVEGRNLTIDYRYGDDDIGRVPGLAAELVHGGITLLMVQGAAVPLVARLGLAVPVVFVFSGDPMLAGLTESLARPPARLTGITLLSAELNGKRLELLRELVPDLKRVAVISNPQHPGETLERDTTQELAERAGIAVEFHRTRTAAELDAALVALAASPPQGLLVFSDGFAIQNRARTIAFATAQRIPLVSGWRIFAESGALCTHGPRLTESYRRLAYYVDRILRGARAEDLPIERPSVFETVVNLRAAAAIGVTVPTSVLARADLVIE